MDIKPFRGWRYAGGDISPQIAPPYDILTQADKDALLARSATNIVAVDLPHMPPYDLGPEEVYNAAAALLEQWKTTGVLRRDEKPALYAYEQGYTWAGGSHTRRAILAGVRATPLGRDIIPHEHTFAGPKADRLKLTTTTRTQISPIFGFYNDPTAGLFEALRAAAADECDLHGELDGVTEKLWVITDEQAISAVRSALSAVGAYIADGHHRYTTALNYRDGLAEAGLIDEQHEANFVMFALVARDDPGLVALPTHRLISGLSESFNLDALCENMPAFHRERCELTRPDLADADSFLGRFGRGAMALLAGGEIHVVRLEDSTAMAAAAPLKPQAWLDLDVAVLHELIIEKALAAWKTDEFAIEYTPDGNAAREAVEKGDKQLAIILGGTATEAVQAVADAGEAMPHKSTYFYPKLATGMVLKPLSGI